MCEACLVLSKPLRFVLECVRNAAQAHVWFAVTNMDANIIAC